MFVEMMEVHIRIAVLSDGRQTEKTETEWSFPFY